MWTKGAQENVHVVVSSHLSDFFSGSLLLKSLHLSDLLLQVVDRASL